MTASRNRHHRFTTRLGPTASHDLKKLAEKFSADQNTIINACIMCMDVLTEVDTRQHKTFAHMVNSLSGR